VIVNQESTRPITAKLELPGAADLSFASPEDPTAKATDGKLQIPPRSAAVVMESRPAD
jgi:hypothetical protein